MMMMIIIFWRWFLTTFTLIHKSLDLCSQACSSNSEVKQPTHWRQGRAISFSLRMCQQCLQQNLRRDFEMDLCGWHLAEWIFQPFNVGCALWRDQDFLDFTVFGSLWMKLLLHNYKPSSTMLCDFRYLCFSLLKEESHGRSLCTAACQCRTHVTSCWKWLDAAS